MFPDYAAYIIDAVLIILLVGAIVQARRAQSALITVRASQNELRDVVDALNRSISEAQVGVDRLRTVAQQTDDALKTQINKAGSLRDELAMITEAGNNLADRIEGGLTQARNSPASLGGRSGFVSGEDDPDHKAKKELLDALKAAR